MTGAFVVEALGVTVQIDASGPGRESFLAQAFTLWRRCLVDPNADPDERVCLAVGADAVQQADALTQLSSHVTWLASRSAAGRVLLLHAGAVSADDGRVVVLVGPSGAGKTTAVAQLGHSFGYVTDETVAVDARGRVLPFPKPLSVRGPGPTKRQVSPEDRGLRVLPRDQHLRIDRVVMLRRDGTTPAVVRPVAELEGLAALAPETSFLRDLSRPLDALAAAVGPAGVAAVHYGEAVHVAEALVDAGWPA